MRIRTRLIPGVVGVVLVLAACSGTPTEESATEEPAEEASVEEPVVEEPAVEEESTMATVAPAVAVEASEVFSVLIPYNAEGGELFAEGSVEAHWYQWDGFYVVLYRGFDATSGLEICAGNSILTDVGFSFVSNSPHVGAADAICVGAATVVDGLVQACGPLLYYQTQIPTSEEGDLYGTLEIGDDTGFRGQSSAAGSNLATTPEFEPGLAAYDLPASGMDDLESVNCG